MLTRWGAALNPDRVLDDYPRPQMVRDHWLNLNGIWQYCITPLTAAPPQTWDGEILVPFCVESQLSGVARDLTPTDRLWYRRSLTLPETSKRTLLHFGAVDYECAVWVNSGFVSAHRGGFDAFSLDITEFVQPGDNELVVGVTDPTSSADQPRGKQHLNPRGIWYTGVSGIWQTVWLEQVPAGQHIDEVQVAPTAECDGIECSVYLNRPSRDPELAVQVRVSLNGRPVSDQVARADRKVRINIPDPQLWSPGKPVLYDVEARLLRIDNPLPADNDVQAVAQLRRDVPLRGGTEAALYGAADVSGAEVLDTVQSYCGLRRIEVGAHPEHGHPVLLLNGAPVFHLGPLDQGWWPDGLHTPPADDAMVYEIEFLKAAGFNTVRKHIKVEPARYYYHCDRMGMLVWQDMPSGFLPAQFVAPNDEGELLRSSRSTAQYEAELQRIIHQLRHHPCIVLWVLHNEGWGQFDSERLTRRISALDPTRPVNATSGWLDMGCGDIVDKHDYRETPTAPEGDGHRALVMGEYGGIGWPIEGHLWDPDMRNWGYQTLQRMEDVQTAYAWVNEAILDMHRNQGVCGAIYTQTTDVEGEVNGLLTYDRVVEKFPREWLASQHHALTGSGTK